MSVCAPSLFPKAPPQLQGPARGSVRPFGLSTALPARPAQDGDITAALSLCPVRQITVTEDGRPFIHTPSMKSKLKTTTQTVEDMQLATDNEDDTD
ncbi:putative ATP-grasp-modified RiPP [Streptomyces sp. UNOC14_S4]|uniref:putative ATP-grasp-modified RiPP n=1 Tax=Streptomyces sp. UNOC14_S4 TaxID=2872340 RepID=UPI001E57F8EF|nr:putative ATP-grasp-modified RiPP [Streptomyces sp. UNOC14_S4]MCC3768178.1 putative ATP-grasp-modified RiPP [Streptomyces sp. UNOC14_S4]